MVKCLNGFLEYLPREGAARVAADVLACTQGKDGDGMLFGVFEGLRTGILVPSKYYLVENGSRK